MKKIYPQTSKTWFKYLTITNYYTFREIEYRKNIIIDSGCDYDEIFQKVLDYREKFKKELINLHGDSFIFVETPSIKEMVEKIKTFWKNSPYIFKEHYKEELIFDTLISESFHSSSIEGAHSTKKRTKEIVKNSLIPKDKSERMILNNYKAVEYIFKNRELKVNDEFVLFLHKMITTDTLDEKSDEDVYRNGGVDITTATQKVIFRPVSDISKMKRMLSGLFDFINLENDILGVEKLYKIIAFHFLYGYIHPHFDGNGRTVRVLFTHLLGQNGFDMFYYISLSEIIHLNEKLKKEYEKAFIDVERSDLDLTYFFYYILSVMIEALQLLNDRVFLYFRESMIFDKIEDINIELTMRQKGILKILARNKTAYLMTSKEIAKKFKLSTQTILKDIRFLVDFKLLKKNRIGLKIYYELSIADYLKK